VAESKQNTLLEILYTIAIAVGAALLGWIPNSASTYGTVVVVVLASVLFIFALFAKWKPK
jgi:membrane protein YdbS with pleckstrin-like domain